MDNNVGILGVQETHYLSTEEAKKSLRGMGGELFCSNTCLNKREHGVAIWLSDKANCVVEKQKCDTNGRVISLIIEHESIKVNIINVYCPTNATERCQFLDSLNEYVLSTNIYECPVIWMGDFNFIEIVKLDKLGGVSTWRGCTAGKKQFDKVKEQYKLVDIYRHMHSDETMFTFRSRSYNSASRLDRIYCSFSFIHKIINVSLIRNVLSDHDIFMVNIDLDTATKGPGVWCLNNSVLQDVEYILLIKNFWNYWQNRYEVYSSPILWWEMGKVRIKDLSKEYSSCKAQKGKNINLKY